MSKSAAKKSGVVRKRKPKYKSKFEITVGEALDKACIPAEYEKERLDYTLELSYTPDWTIPISPSCEGRTIVLEAKGKFDYDSRRKMLAVKAKHPERDIRMVFMRNNKLGKGSKMRYGEWCDRHGFPWSVYPQLPIKEGDIGE